MTNKMKLNSEDYYFSIGNKKYYFNLDKLKEICLVSSTEDSSEKEITEAYTLNEENREMELSSKIDREIKSTGNPQNDMIIYDSIKLFLERILDSDDDKEINLALSISINTLIAYGLLVEVK